MFSFQIETRIVLKVWRLVYRVFVNLVFVLKSSYHEAYIVILLFFFAFDFMRDDKFIHKLFCVYIFPFN